MGGLRGPELVLSGTEKSVDEKKGEALSEGKKPAAPEKGSNSRHDGAELEMRTTRSLRYSEGGRRRPAQGERGYLSHTRGKKEYNMKQRRR